MLKHGRYGRVVEAVCDGSKVYIMVAVWDGI